MAYINNIIISVVCTRARHYTSVVLRVLVVGVTDCNAGMFQSPDLYETPSGESQNIYYSTPDGMPGHGFVSPRTASLMSPRMERALAAFGGVTPTQIRQRPRMPSRASPTRPGVNFGGAFRSSTAPPVLTEISHSTYTELGQSPPSSTPVKGFPDAPSIGSATFLQSTTNGINILLGVGVLSLPFAFSVSGWVVGAGLLVLLSITTNYTGKLIGRLMAHGRGTIRSFPDIGAAAFGSAGQWIISVVFFIELFSACGMYLILCGDNLEALVTPIRGAGNVTQTQLTLLAAGVMFPTALTSNLSFLSYFSAVGLLSSCFLGVAVVAIGVLNGPRGSGTFLEPAPTQLVTDIERGPLAIGLVMVGFAGHACFPSIRCSMSQPEQFGRVLNWSYAACFTVYMSVASLGYLMYGTLTQKEITLNIVGDDNASKTVKNIAIVATVLIVVNPITKFGLTMNPISLMVEEAILGVDDKVFGKGIVDGEVLLLDGDDEASHSKVTWGRFCCSKLIRVILTVSCVAVAVSLPFFARVVGFIGAFCSCFVSIVFPIAAAMRLLKMSSCEFCVCTILLVVGCVCTIWGTVAVFISPV